MTKENPSLNLELEEKRSVEKREVQDISEENLTQSELSKLFELADKQIEKFSNRIDKQGGASDSEEILKLKQELSDSSSDNQEEVGKDFEMLDQLSIKSRQLLEKLKKGIKRAVAIGILASSFSMPNFSSEARADMIVDEQVIEQQIETRKLEVKDLRQGMIIDGNELEKSFSDISKTDSNEWVVVVALEKGADEKRGKIIEINRGGPTGSISDTGLALRSFKEGKKIRKMHSHPLSGMKKEIEASGSVKYDQQKFAFPPSFGDMASAHFSWEFCEKNGLGKEAIVNQELVVAEPSGIWKYGIDDMNNLRIKKFSNFIDSWREKRNAMTKKMSITREELEVVNKFSPELNRNVDIVTEYNRTLEAFFQAKAKEVEDNQLREHCLSIAKKADEIGRLARNEAIKDAGLNQEDFDAVNRVADLTGRIYGFRDPEKASRENREKLINELIETYKEKFGISLSYVESSGE